VRGFFASISGRRGTPLDARKVPAERRAFSVVWAAFEELDSKEGLQMFSVCYRRGGILQGGRAIMQWK